MKILHALAAVLAIQTENQDELGYAPASSLEKEELFAKDAFA